MNKFLTSLLFLASIATIISARPVTGTFYLSPEKKTEFGWIYQGGVCGGPLGPCDEGSFPLDEECTNLACPPHSQLVFIDVAQDSAAFSLEEIGFNKPTPAPFNLNFKNHAVLLPEGYIRAFTVNCDENEFKRKSVYGICKIDEGYHIEKVETKKHLMHEYYDLEEIELYTPVKN